MKKKTIKETIDRWWKEKVMKSNAFVLPEKHRKPVKWNYKYPKKSTNSEL